MSASNPNYADNVPMSTGQAAISLRTLNTQAFNLTPTALVTLYEIDVSDLRYENDTFNPDEEPVFRFHNNVKLFANEIKWQGYTYYPAPISAQGFEYSSNSTLPTPKISIAVPDENISDLVRLKKTLKSLGDLAGAKLTRIRTHAMFLDADNWTVIGGTPPGYSPDPYAQFEPDIYFFSRKSADNKNYLEFELTSFIDLDGLKLPNRLLLSQRCTARYRGEGCLYEYEANRVTAEHGSDSVLPIGGTTDNGAPPVANRKDETFIGNLLPSSIKAVNYQSNSSESQITAFSSSQNYKVGDAFYVTKDNLKYYYVVIQEPPIGTPPPNDNYYEADECSKTVHGCELRWGGWPIDSPPFYGGLPFVGFPGANRIR
ncbi:Phage minor tail protein L [Gammaproteobacteria bacterium]